MRGRSAQPNSPTSISTKEDAVYWIRGVGATYPQVFRFAGTAAFLAYSMSLPQNSIWWGRNWGMTLKSMFDGLVYGALVGGTFGWLWPR